MRLRRSRALWAFLGVLHGAVAASATAAADPFEARFGVFAHSVGFEEQGSADVNAELVFPRLPIELPPELSWFVPQPHIGVMINTIGKTSYVYGGFVWTFNLTERLFFQPVFGGAIHDGKTDNPPPGWVALGCPNLFHTGVSLGFRVDERWTLYGTWEHISNANLCSRNVGLNDYGIRLGYKF